VKIKTLIIDDEPLARKRIKQLLDHETDFQLIGENSTVAEAISDCEELAPDLIFLDVEMPDGSGFDVLERLAHDAALPAVIFVTAYDHYTIKAFEFHAVDYLLKPFSEERFRQATAKVRKRYGFEDKEEFTEQIKNLIGHVKLNQDFLERLVINHNDRLIVVPTKEIDWITAYGNYLRVHTQGKTYLLRETINQIVKRLNPEIFLRIHRSTIINIECIKEFQPMFGGNYTVVLKDETEFVLSRNYRKEVLSRFEA
jgi:two-component system LytT family response regulator